MQENLYLKLCSYENLELAFKKARKRKTLKPYVIEFEQNLKESLFKLRFELLLYIYKPASLKTFILRDPKTRTISKSLFRDRVVHHAVCNIIEPILSKDFIYDSFEGWMAYAKQANTYNLRRKLLEPLENKFRFIISSKELGRYLKLF